MKTSTRNPRPTPASRWYVARITKGAVAVGRCTSQLHAERRTRYLTGQGQHPLMIRAISDDLALRKATHLYADQEGISQ